MPIVEPPTIPLLSLSELLAKINAEPTMKLPDRMQLAQRLNVEAAMFLNRKVEYVNHQERSSKSRNGIFLVPGADGRVSMRVIPTNNIIMLGADDFVHALCGARLLYTPR